MKLYHIDRVGTLKDGQRIELLPLTVLPERTRASRLLLEFQRGISLHGKGYLEGTMPEIPFDSKDQKAILPGTLNAGKWKLDSSIIELVLELVRRNYFPDKNSRLTALFATDDIRCWENLLDKKNFLEEQVFELNVADDTPRYDASWLKFGSYYGYDERAWWMGMDIARGYDMAYKYWSGESTTSPQYEYLVQLPIAQIHLVHAS